MVFEASVWDTSGRISDEFSESRIQNLGLVKKAAWLPAVGIENFPRNSLLRPGHPFWGKHFLLHTKFGFTYQRLDPPGQTAHLRAGR